MKKVYVIELCNGYTYEDQEYKTLGIFSTKGKAEKAYKDIKAVAENEIQRLKAVFPNRSVSEFTLFDVSCSARHYTLSVNEVELDKILS